MDQDQNQAPRPAPSNKIFEDGQIARAVYLRNMAGMKEILNMGEFRIGDRKSKEYKFFKKVVMDEYYNAMTELFTKFSERGVLQKCTCGTDIRDGYKPCPLCNGAGHCNTEEFNEWLNSDEEPAPPQE